MIVLAGIDDPNGYADQKTPEQLLGIGLPHLRSAQGPVARRLLEEGGIALPCFPGRFLELGLSRRIPLLLVQGHAPVVMGLRVSGGRGGLTDSAQAKAQASCDPQGFLSHNDSDYRTSKFIKISRSPPRRAQIVRPLFPIEPAARSLGRRERGLRSTSPAEGVRALRVSTCQHERTRP